MQFLPFFIIKKKVVIEKLLSLFIEGSEGYNRLNVFLQTFKTANNKRRLLLLINYKSTL